MHANFISAQTSHVVIPAEVVEFDAFDSKGRRIGVSILKTEKVYEEIGDHDPIYFSTIKPGSYFGAQVQATRNGEVFGGSKAWGEFSTKAERDAYIAKRVEASRRAAEKNSD